MVRGTAHLFTDLDDRDANYGYKTVSVGLDPAQVAMLYHIGGMPNGHASA
jgi:hypothetical protein